MKELIKSPLPGTVTAYKVKEGDLIPPGTLVAIIDSMKMLNEIHVDKKCLIKKLIAPINGHIPINGELIEIFTTDE